MKDIFGAPEKAHKNHRERMRNRIMRSGFSDMNEEEMLEVMLYSVVMQRDTKPVANALIQRFGDLRGVFSASERELLSAEGVGVGMAGYIKTLRSFIDEYEERCKLPEPFVLGSVAAQERLHELFENVKDEMMYLICLDKNSLVIAEVKVGGAFDFIRFNVNEAAKAAVMNEAKYVVAAHNHPSGKAEPSRADEIGTATLRRALLDMGIELTESVIVTKNEIYGILSGYHADRNEELDKNIQNQ